DFNVDEDFGDIVNSQGEKVADLTYYTKGIGTAIFKPTATENYDLVLFNNSTIPLPDVEIEGFLLHVNNLDIDLANIEIVAQQRPRSSKFRLKGVSDGLTFFSEELTFGKNNKIEISLNKSKLPDGELTLNIVDEKGRVYNSRPIWIERNKLDIGFEESPPGFSEHSYTIKVSDAAGKPLIGTIAIAVNKGPGTVNSRNSNFGAGHVGDSYLNSTIYSGRQLRFFQDLQSILRTQNLESLSGGDGPIKGNYTVQKGLEIEGYAFNFNNEVLRNTEIQAMAKSDQGLWIGTVTTNDEGYLKIEDLHIQGDAKMVFRTQGEDVKSSLVKLMKPVESKTGEIEPGMVEVSKRNSGTTENNIINYKPLNADTDNLVELEEVKVYGKPYKRKKYSPSVYDIEVPPNRIKFQDFDRPREIPQLLAEMPGLYVTGMGTLNPKVSFLRFVPGPVIYLLDGFPIPNYDPTYGSSRQSRLAEIMSMISASDLDRIEVMIGPEASMFGSRGAGGAIAFYTRNGLEYDYINRKMGQLDVAGYTPTKNFEEYSSEVPNKVRENSNLIYWNPELKLDQNGEAVINLPFGSENEIIEIHISTIRADGEVRSARRVISF
ncbi:MAG: Plug domain-containing protein, partial [Flavobacteriaceae bacterium]|nr:Plug domain-containing protein [Flavobacteriaceae bacterium]